MKFKINSEKMYQIVIHFFMAVLILICLFPLVYVVGQSFMSEREFYERGILAIIPREPTLFGYKSVLFATDAYVKGFLVSVVRVVVGTALTMMCTMILGYLLSKEDLSGGKGLFALVMLTILYAGGLVPTYLTVAGLGLLNSFWAMIIPGLVDTWQVLVFKQFFSNIPKDVVEAADLDGCTEFRKMISVVIPSSKPVIAANGLFTAVNHWNSWMDALIYLNSEEELYPLQLLLRNILMTASIKDATGVRSDLNSITPTGMRMAVVVIGTVPILCVYPFLQKYFTAGVYTGAVKE